MDLNFFLKKNSIIFFIFPPGDGSRELYSVCIKIVNQAQVFINLKSMYFLDFSIEAGMSLGPDRQQQCILIMTSLPSAPSIIPFHFLPPDLLGCCSAFSTCWMLVDLHITHHFYLDVLGTSQS